LSAHRLRGHIDMINDINQNKSLLQVLQSSMNNLIHLINCIKIGEIISFNKEDQTCSVQILYKPELMRFRNKKVITKYPVLEKVPVVIMGGGTSYITHPISAGDQCLLLFNDNMIDNWWATGEARPSDYPRFHDIADAIAIVGLRALPNALKNYSDYLNLHYSDNSSIIVGNTIEVNNATVNINGNTNVTGDVSVSESQTIAKNLSVAGDQTVTGSITAATINATSAATGSFVSLDQKVVTVSNGIITSIVGS